MRNVINRTIALASASVLALSLAACGGDGKPSKAEYQQALTDMLAAGMPENTNDMERNIADKLISCLADESYDDLSAQVVTDVVEKGESATLSAEDEKVMSSAASTCQTKVAQDVANDEASRSDSEPSN